MRTPHPYQRLRLFVRAVLALGVLASVAANILHADANPISRTIAAWPPLALYLAIEMISRVPRLRPKLAWIRVPATTLIAGIAAWVSYWHMAAVVFRYGEDASAAHLLPLSVDGLIVVASVSLVELAAAGRTVPARTQVIAAAPEPELTVEQRLERTLDEVAAYRSAAGKHVNRDELRALLSVGAEKAGALLPAARGERVNGVAVQAVEVEAK